MKKTFCLLITILFLFILNTAFSQNRYWISTVSSNWNNTANWSAASGGAGGASVPNGSNVAIFNGVGGKNGTCILDITPIVGGITISGYSGILDLQGFSITTTGTNTFTSGTMSNSGAAASLVLNTLNTTTFNGTLFNVDITGTSARLYFNGSVFNGSISLTKSDNNSDNGTGGNTFNTTVSLTNAGTALLQLAGTNPDIFQGTLTLNLNNTGSISLARVAAGNQFNGDILINYNALGNVFFGAGNGTSTLANLKTISVNSYSAAGCGNLSLGNLIQTGTTTQTLTLAGNNTATLTIGPSSIFNGSLTISTPDINLQTSTFNNVIQITKTGTNTNNLRGGNFFASTTTINNQGGDFIFGSTPGDAGDTFNGTSTFNNLGGNRIRIAEETSGTVFNGTATFNSSAATDVNNRIQISRLAGGQTTFNGAVFFISNGNASDIHISYGAGTSTTFNGPVSFTSSASNGGEFFIGVDGDVIFTSNIEFNSTCSDIIYATQGVGAATFGNGTMTIGSVGFAQGQIRFKNFSQTGSTAQALTLTGTASLYLGPTTQFNGNVNFITPQIYLNGCTFNAITYLEKNGASSNTGSGSNNFNGVTTIVNSGSGNFISGNTSVDNFNNDLTLTNTGSALISMADNSSGNIFAGNITVNSTAGGGIYFGNNASASASLASGKTITVGGSGFSNGDLRLKRFTQLGSTAQALTLSGTSTLTLGPSSQFGGNVNFITPQIYLNGCTFNGTTYIEKNGATSNTGTGSNNFNGVTTLVNSGSGNFISGNTSIDNFNNNLTLTNTGSALISMADNSLGNVFAGNIIVNSTAGGGIYFGNNSTASASLASGKTITVGASGFSSGELRLKRFTQLGATAQALTLTGAASILTLGPSTQFGGNVNFIAPQLYLSGVTFSGTTYLEKNGATDNVGTGGDTFNGATTIVNSGSGTLDLASTSPEIFNSTLTVNNTGTYRIQIGVSSAGNIFNGNVTINHGGSTASNVNTIVARNAGSTATFNGSLTLNCTNNGSTSTGVIIANDGAVTINGNVIVSTTNGRGVLFGAGAGTVTLTNGYTISAGTFTTGTLTLKGFTQAGSSTHTVTLTGTAILTIGPSSTFNGAVNFLSPRVTLDGGIFNATTTIEKNGASNDDNVGGNTFNATTTLTSSGINRWRLAGTTADTYNGNVTFVRTGAGVFDVAYLLTNNFAGNITVNSVAGVTFGGGGGIIQFNGTNAQSINKTVGSASPILPRITVAKTSNTITLNTDLSISTSATFTTGIMSTSTTNYLNFADNATVSGTNDASYVDGPVRKTGNDIFTFPVGNSGFYRPVSISAPGVVTDHFTAQYFRTAQTYGGPSTWDPSFYSLSGCEYWILNRTGGTSNVFVTLSWNASACGGSPYSDLTALRVARFNSGTSKWVNEGNGSTTGNPSNGTVISSAAVTTFSPFTLASTNSLNPLPIELTSFWAKDIDSTVELNWITLSEENNDFFSIERSATGLDFKSIGKTKGAGTSSKKLTYRFYDEAPLSGLSYYRLKQTDFDGNETYSKSIAVQRKGEGLVFMIYPNPAVDEFVKFNQKANIVITNSVGQVIATMLAVEGLDASILTSGVYIIKNQKGEVVRFIKK